MNLLATRGSDCEIHGAACVGLHIAVVDMEPSAGSCPICKGSGEVETGITLFDGREVTKVVPNPYAGQIVQLNTLCAGWSISICKRCGGCGLELLKKESKVG